ncbi:ABC transporter substrate-binding protein [Actinomadura scrupuli]|uniref:ABC transporter substrate-binding protein n=1 Tax=Actinomadura scrupuli TaxID=559629 RepID=UPI003D95A211
MTATARPGRLRMGVCLSLSGKYARFGRQAALGLETWRVLDGAADLIIEDDHSDPRLLATGLRRLSGRCDVLLGPYSTRLARTAGDVAAELGLLIWNHGGAGDDVQAAHPGHVVSVSTPASRYAEPFLAWLAGDPARARLWIVHGKGAFARQVAAGAEATARTLGLGTTRLGPGDGPPSPGPPWDLLCAGTFEEDVHTVVRASRLPHPPRTVCAVAAGIGEFGRAVPDAEGIFGVGQWFPSGGGPAALGPAEVEFLAAYPDPGPPDYPAVQAAAAAVLAAHCMRLAGGTARELVWAAAASLDTSTLFGDFAIDPVNGLQLGHRAVLLRWTRHGPVPAGQRPEGL